MNKLRNKTDVCEILGVSIRGLDRLIAGGKIRIVKVGRLTKISQAEVDAFIERNSHGGLPA